MPRLYRDAPLNSIWEGSGNVTALDLLRAIARSPGSLDALRIELSLSVGADRRLDRAVERLWADIGEVAAGDQVAAQFHARRLAGMLTEIFSVPADLADRAKRAHDLAVPGAAEKLADMVEDLAQTRRSAA